MFIVIITTRLERNEVCDALKTDTEVIVAMLYARCMYKACILRHDLLICEHLDDDDDDDNSKCNVLQSQEALLFGQTLIWHM